MNSPVYPKEDPEYRKRVLNNFYNKVKSTKWDKVEVTTPTSTRGRKPTPPPKPIVDLEKPRNKQIIQNTSPLDRWIKK